MITKVFTNGRKQAVRIPKEFRLETSEVEIRRDDQTGDIILSPPRTFKDIVKLLERIPKKERDEFLSDRGLIEAEPKELF